MDRPTSAITVAAEPYGDGGPRWAVARALMGGIDAASLALGPTDLRLGAGDRRPEAVALSESSGWERVHVGGDGRAVPARHIWLTKLLTPAT